MKSEKLRFCFVTCEGIDLALLYDNFKCELERGKSSNTNKKKKN